MAPSALKIRTILLPKTYKFLYRLTKKLQILVGRRLRSQTPLLPFLKFSTRHCTLGDKY